MNIVIFSALLACGRATPEPTAAVSAAVAPPPAEIERFLAESADYAYSPAGRRDPFQDFAERSRAKMLYPGVYKVIGIIWGTSAPQALIADEAGDTFVVSEGSYLGESFGRVAAIRDNGIEVVTEYRTLTDERVTETVVLRLREG